MTLIIGLYLLVHAISFLCSLMETTFLSTTPGFVAQEEKEHPRRGKLLAMLKENAERPLSAILTINTIANTAGATAIGALVYEEFGDASVSLTSAALTVTILTFGEIIPKTLGAVYWRQIIGVGTYIIQTFILLVYPIVLISEALGRAVKPKEAEPEVTRNEVIATAEVGVDEGTLQSKESTVIRNLLMLDNVFVSDIMTPRSVMFALDAQMTVEDVFERYRPIRFSRIPVYRGSIDQVIGMTLRHRIHECMSSDQHSMKLADLVSPIGTVNERTSVAQAIDYFIKRKEHLALAVDEYGIVTGLVSLEDTIETLLGVEIVDELDQVTDMRQFALDQWKIRRAQYKRN